MQPSYLPATYQYQEVIQEFLLPAFRLAHCDLNPKEMIGGLMQ